MKKIAITDEDEFLNICDITTKICGLNKMDLYNDSRKQNINLARIIACNIARFEKRIHYTTIAKVVNRTRSNIYHYEKKHKIYFATWPLYRNYFDAVYNAYHKKKLYHISKRQFLHELSKHDIPEVDVIQVRIFITSKYFNYTINSDYKSFTKTIELVKGIMYKFEHTINIEV